MKSNEKYVAFLRGINVGGHHTVPMADLQAELKKGNTVFSVLDLSISKTPEAVKALEKYYGKEITTRNWNTISQIGKKIISHQHL